MACKKSIQCVKPHKGLFCVPQKFASLHGWTTDTQTTHNFEQINFNMPGAPDLERCGIFSTTASL